MQRATEVTPSPSPSPSLSLSLSVSLSRRSARPRPKRSRDERDGDKAQDKQPSSPAARSSKPQPEPDAAQPHDGSAGSTACREQGAETKRHKQTERQTEESETVAENSSALALPVPRAAAAAAAAAATWQSSARPGRRKYLRYVDRRDQSGAVIVKAEFRDADRDGSTYFRWVELSEVEGALAEAHTQAHTQAHTGTHTGTHTTVMAPQPARSRVAKMARRHRLGAAEPPQPAKAQLKRARAAHADQSIFE